jgi:hypothetical protein
MQRIDDGGAAVARAGLPPGWREVARHGVVFLPAGHPEFEERIAAASSAFANDLLDLEDEPAS